MEWEVAPTALVHKAGDEAGDGVATSPALFGWGGRAVAVLGMHKSVPSSAGVGWVLCGAVGVVTLLGTALACLKWLLVGWAYELAQHDKMLWVSKSLWHCLRAGMA